MVTVDITSVEDVNIAGQSDEFAIRRAHLEQENYEGSEPLYRKQA